jgi:NAD(P)-dependent dehydrogenase (short-subunit alcohol dehydrogenase family)
LRVQDAESGGAIAFAFAEAGADLVLGSRTVSEVEALAQEARVHSVKVEALLLDIADAAQVRTVADQAISLMGHIDILVNNAGTVVRKPAVEITEADWDFVLNTNLKGLFFLTQAIGKHMIARGEGRIINISSVASLVGSPTRAAYTASKRGVNSLTRVLAVEWGPYGVTVNAIAPSFTRTPLTESLFSDPATLAPLLQRTPLGRFPEVEDIAAAAVYIASDAGRNVTGQVITVDGGRTISE